MSLMSAVEVGETLKNSGLAQVQAIGLADGKCGAVRCWRVRAHGAAGLAAQPLFASHRPAGCFRSKGQWADGRP